MRLYSMTAFALGVPIHCSSFVRRTLSLYDDNGVNEQTNDLPLIFENSSPLKSSPIFLYNCSFQRLF